MKMILGSAFIMATNMPLKFVYNEVNSWKYFVVADHFSQTILIILLFHP